MASKENENLTVLITFNFKAEFSIFDALKFRIAGGMPERLIIAMANRIEKGNKLDFSHKHEKSSIIKATGKQKIRGCVKQSPPVKQSIHKYL
jgi:hypothetical protein